MVAERSEGTAAEGRRDLDVGRARPMDDRNQRAGAGAATAAPATVARKSSATLIVL